MRTENSLMAESENTYLSLNSRTREAYAIATTPEIKSFC
jgi:hypothetical protein